MTDPFSRLGLSHDTTAQAIKMAYRKLAKQCHPDLRSDKEAAAAEFRELTTIYEQALAMIGKTQVKYVYRERPKPPPRPIAEQIDLGILDNFEIKQFGAIIRTVQCGQELLRWGGILYIKFTEEKKFLKVFGGTVEQIWTMKVPPGTVNNQRFRLKLDVGELILALVGSRK